MPLPEPFSDIEHLQLVVRRYLNKQIREDFRDIFNGGETWEPEVGTTRGSMLRALLHEDSDPIHVTAVRMMLYYFTYEKAKALQAPVYGIPVPEYDRTFKYKPQIHLKFYQTRFNVPSSTNNDGVSSKPVESTISFRLMNETSESLTITELERYANRIKTNFGASGGYRWEKGKVTVNYTDKEKGYKLRLYCKTKADGKTLIEQILDIQQHIPDWTKMTTSENENPLERYPNIPTPRTTRILGKTVEKPQLRPVVDVRYRYSTIHIHGLGQPRGLHDLTNTIKNPIAA